MRNFNLRNALILSLALHFVWALGLFVSSLQPQRPLVETVTVDFVKPEETVARKKVPTPPSKQIVEQDKSLNDEKPDSDAFLSAHDQRVKKQTVARERGEFRNLKKSTASQTAQAPGQQVEKPVPTPNRRPTLKDLMGSDPVAQIEKRKREQQGNGAQAAVAGGEASRTNDYLKNVDQGAETTLNTREFKYFTYYSRIRRQLSQYWEPKVKEKMGRMFKQGRSIASNQDHITKLLIVLNEKGTLVRVQVLSESGVTDLDDAATEAFRAAAPFPNPPRGIVESDGTVKIRWDFVLES